MSITWNGVSSDTIGVVVERIPNRYVPTRRFSPQQVAGRNGNILLVDKSFPNVEQEYEVYLSAEAQGLPSVARACAEWLMGPDGYCRLEDSYDTTVYREAFLMGGYDLENILNKFGRCTITFSCKPQKYLLTGDTPIEIPAGITTYTGDVVQFDGVTGASITSLSTTITPTQDLHGYANPWPAGGGKNKYSGGDIALGGSNPRTKSINIDTIPAGTYYFSTTYGGTAASGYGIQFINANNNNIGERSANGTLTLTDDAVKVYAYMSSSSYSDGKTVIFSNIQVELGSTATTYEPYSNICPISGRTGLNVYVSPTSNVADATTYAVDWTTPAGTVYGGTLDVVTGVLTVDRVNLGLGTLNWSMSSSHIFMSSKPSPAIYEPDRTEIAILCDMLNPVPYNALGANDFCICSIFSGVTASGSFWAKASSYPDAASFKAAMSGAQCVSKLATPLTYQLTPQEVEALVGTNNVWSSSGDVSVTVVTPLGGIVTNPTPFEARPMLEVSGVGEITINGKSIQILESVSDFLIDCEAMEAEDNSKIYCMDFPELSGGENEIVGDGSITALTVTPRWWTL